MEIKDKLAKGDIQSILTMSKLLSDMSNDLKAYHLTTIDQLKNDEEAETEQKVLDDHELKVMELIGHIGKLVGESFQTKTSSDNDILVNPQPTVPAQTSTNNRLVDRHLDLLGDLVLTIWRVVENPDLADKPVLRS